MLSLVSLYIACLATIIVFSDHLDKILTENTRSELSNWLLTVHKTKHDLAWENATIEYFDRFFGRDLFAFKYMRRCVLVTSVGVMFSWTYCWLVFDEPIFKLLGRGGIINDPDMKESVYIFILTYVCATLASVIPDYISTIETRLVLNVAHDYRRKRLRLLFLDFLLTTAILFFFGILSTVAGGGLALWLKPGSWFGFTLDNGGVMDFVVFGSMASGIVSTYLTSIWIWGFVLGGYVIRVVSSMAFPLHEFAIQRVDVANHPCRAIGVAVGIVAFFVFFAVALVTLLVGNVDA